MPGYLRGPYAPTVKGRAAALGAAMKRRKAGKSKLATVATVKRLISNREEDKHFDSLQTAATVDFSGNIYQISAIAQGTQDQQRIGDAVELQWVDTRFLITLGTSPNKVRVILLQWHEMSGAGVSPTVGSVLENLGSAVTFLQAYVYSNRKAYTILRDKTYEVETAGPVTAIDHWRVKTGFRKRVQYSVGSSTNSQNSLFLIVVSDDGVATYPTFSHHTRVCYKDA